nr:DUF2520 domain-containing protein [Corynebacterium sp. TAE3-ERU12]
MGCPWGVTVGDELARTVASLLVGELGGRVVEVPERSRPLYHAAMAHGANHLGAVVADATGLLAEALADGRAAADVRDDAAALLGPLLQASLDNVLRWGENALTGPAARDDADTVGKHIAAIADSGRPAVEVYRSLARRTAEMRNSGQVRRMLDGRQ